METIYKTFDVALELKQTSTNAPFYVIEGDNGNKIRITVTDGGSAVALTDCRVIAVFSKSSGTSMQDSAEAGGGVTIGGTYNNEVTVALRPASIAPGQVECELQIYSDENKTTLITTAKFNFECQRAIFNEYRHGYKRISSACVPDFSVQRHSCGGRTACYCRGFPCLCRGRKGSSRGGARNSRGRKS